MRNETDPRLQLVAASTQTRALMFALCVLLPLLVMVFSVFNRSGASRPLADSLLTTLGAGLGLVLLLWLLLDRAMCRHRLEASDRGLQIKTSFYSQTLAWPELLLDAARIVDLDERTEFRPGLKTNGYALPGFKSGRFRLKNGEQAFVAIAGDRRALWLPTRRGFGLLLQAPQPEALLRRLAELAAGPARR